MSSESKDRLFLTLISIAVFFPSLDIYFVVDDISHIENASKNIADIGFHYYRPLTIMTLIIDRVVWGYHHFGYHFTNLLIHIVNVSLVYHFAKTLKNSRFFALSSSLLFLLHPIHSTSLFWISGRVDMLCTLFYLLAIICFTNYVRSREKHQLIISSICFVFSLLSKEMAISFPLVLMAYIFVNSSSKLKQRIVESVQLTKPYWIILFAFALFRVFTAGMTVLSGTVHTNIQPLHLLKNLATFIGMLIVPGGHIAISNFLKANPELFIAFSISLLIAVVIALKWMNISMNCTI